MDYELLSTYTDPKRIKVIRLDYASIFDRLALASEGGRRGLWMLITISPTRKPAARLKEYARRDEMWRTLETFTRLARPRSDGEFQGYEIWARLM